jgi:hypothetical protein
VVSWFSNAQVSMVTCKGKLQSVNPSNPSQPTEATLRPPSICNHAKAMIHPGSHAIFVDGFGDRLPPVSLEMQLRTFQATRRTYYPPLIRHSTTTLAPSHREPILTTPDPSTHIKVSSETSSAHLVPRHQPFALKRTVVNSCHTDAPVQTSNKHIGPITCV